MDRGRFVKAPYKHDDRISKEALAYENLLGREIFAASVFFKPKPEGIMCRLYVFHQELVFSQLSREGSFDFFQYRRRHCTALV